MYKSNEDSKILRRDDMMRLSCDPHHWLHLLFTDLRWSLTFLPLSLTRSASQLHRSSTMWQIVIARGTNIHRHPQRKYLQIPVSSSVHSRTCSIQPHRRQHCCTGRRSVRGADPAIHHRLTSDLAAGDLRKIDRLTGQCYICTSSSIPSIWLTGRAASGQATGRCPVEDPRSNPGCCILKRSVVLLVCCTAFFRVVKSILIRRSW